MRLGSSVVDSLPPVAAQALRKSLGCPGPRTIALEDLDDELARGAALFSTSQDEARAFLESLRIELPKDRPDDPFSGAYREWTWEIYRKLSGRAHYSIANEASPFDLPQAILRPFPFETGSAAIVGEDLVARGHLMRCIGEPSGGLIPPARLVEFGPGWGNLTSDLVSTGFVVTAVEVEKQFCQLLRERCPQPSKLTVVETDMLGFTTAEPFAAAIFFESFHHCSDHLAMLEGLHDIVAPGGKIFFACEPIQKMDYPWGPRLDGMSAWSTRSYGWLELGFDAKYFEMALARTGWKSERRQIAARWNRADVVVATADPTWHKPIK